MESYVLHTNFGKNQKTEEIFAKTGDCLPTGKLSVNLHDLLIHTGFQKVMKLQTSYLNFTKTTDVLMNTGSSNTHKPSYFTHYSTI
jgi:hypothetical protein